MPYLLQGGFIRLRALRARKEIPDELLNHVKGCDMSEAAIETFKANIKLNGLGLLKRER